MRGWLFHLDVTGPTLKKRKLKLREVNGLVQNHTAPKACIWSCMLPPLSITQIRESCFKVRSEGNSHLSPELIVLTWTLTLWL